MAIKDKLTGWTLGPPPIRDDGALAIVRLRPDVEVDAQPHNDEPIIVGRWSSKLRTTGGAHRVEYDDVVEHIEIDAQSNDVLDPASYILGGRLDATRAIKTIVDEMAAKLEDEIRAMAAENA